MSTLRIAYFVSSHGFGHAARSAAIIHALCERCPQIRIHLFTDVPDWFFNDCPAHVYHRPPAPLDVGMVQTDPFKMDLTATRDALNRSFPYPQPLIKQLAATVARHGCQAVISDIAPAGLLVANRLGIPGILVENFTWDWIYESYAQQFPDFQPHIDYLSELYALADIHIKATPYCASGRADLIVPPISRLSRRPPTETRRQLNISREEKAVLVTLGGIPADHQKIHSHTLPPETVLVIAGARKIPAAWPKQIRYIPIQSPLTHPDLVMAVDGVIGKLGYSTLAEVYAAGVPFGYLQRPDFRESPRLEKFVASHMTTVAMDSQVLSSEALGQSVAAVCALTRRRGPMPNGAHAVAHYLAEQILSANLSERVHP